MSRNRPSRSRCVRSRSGSARSSSTARAVASSRPRPACGSTAARSGCSRSRSSCSTSSPVRVRASSAGELQLGASTGPAAIVVPLLLCEFQRAHPGVKISLTVSDTQSVVERVAARELELGIVGAARRHRAARFEPFFDDEVILACPPGHAFAGRTVSIDELRGENVIVMQEGAGVRQIVEDELRGLGLRLRDLDVRSRARPAGVGAERRPGRIRRRVHLALGRRVRARRGDADVGAGRGARREAGDLAGSRRRPHRHARRRRVRRVRARRAREVIVRWGLAELAELAGERPFVVASPRWRHVLDAADRWEEVPSHRIEVPDGVDTIVAVGGGSAIDTAQGGVRGDAACRSSRFRRRTPARSGRRSSASAIPTGGCAVAAPAHSCTRSSTSRSSRSTCRAPETVGTALNALAHAAEALYVGGTQRRGRHRSAGGSAADRGVAAARRRASRRPRGAHRAPARRLSCGRGPRQVLPRARPRAGAGARRPLRRPARGVERPDAAARHFASTSPSPATAIARFGAALGSDDPPARVEELARLGGFERLRDLGIPAEAPAEVAEAVAERPGAKANPRPVTPADVEQLLSSIW